MDVRAPTPHSVRMRPGPEGEKETQESRSPSWEAHPTTVAYILSAKMLENIIFQVAFILVKYAWHEVLPL